MSESAFFWNLFAKQYAKQAIGNPEAYEHKLDYSKKYFTTETTALEIGCGTGTTALIHAPHVKHIRATDISPNMINIAKVKAADQGITNVDFETIAISKIEIDEPLDIVFALSILHLVDDKEGVIKDIYSWLKPGGTLITSTVTFEKTSIWHFLLPIGGLLKILPKVKFFTEDNLKTSFINAGFKIDYQWRPEGGDSVFIVCKKPE
jgi:2-polyprenyl-3-methyl-5-hydroxy-6-metoxy-1,4-benzoquinol methylase